MEKIKVGIVGGAGYTGGETIRLVLNHPNAQLIFVNSRSNAGNPLHHVHPDLLGETDLTFTDDLPETDVLFLCLGHGESMKFLQENKISASTKIIDLSQDFRLGETSGDRIFVYGLPEINKDSLRTAQNVANPGCFATAIELGLIPLANAGILKDTFTTGITGSTGAGQKLQSTTQFTWRVNNISAYKTLTHQHLREINQTIRQLQPEFNGEVNFLPWRGDFARGIYVSSCVAVDASLEEIKKLYMDFYEDHPFTVVSDAMIDLKQVVNTNKCLIGLEKENGKLVIHSAIDNLLKGASGQAVQNMNLMCGVDEEAGLRLKSLVF